MAQDFFSMLGGNMFGGGGGVYDSLLSDEQKRRINQQTLMNIGAKLLQAGGPSTTRTSLGQAMGGAFLAGQEARQTAESNALTQMLTKQKIDEYKKKQQVQQVLQNYLAPGGLDLSGAAPATADATAQATPQMPVAGGAPALGGVRPAAAQTPATTPNAQTARSLLADKYRTLATIIGPLDETKANAYLNIADKLAPVDIPTGQPFEVKGPDGKNILVQRTTGGSIVPVSGYSPAGLTEHQALQYGLDLAKFGLSKKEFERGNYTVRDTANGMAFVPAVPGLPVIPVMNAGVPAAAAAAAPGASPAAAPSQLKSAGAKPTADQSNAIGFAQRMERANAILGQRPEDYPGYGTTMAQSIPFVGGVAGRNVMSSSQQQYDQAAQDWIRAKLRKESGAVIGPEEQRTEYETYFPMPGEGPDVIRQKARARELATKAMQQSAGEFYKPWSPSEDEQKEIYGAVPKAQKQMVWDPVSKSFKFK